MGNFNLSYHPNSQKKLYNKIRKLGRNWTGITFSSAEGIFTENYSYLLKYIFTIPNDTNVLTFK